MQSELKIAFIGGGNMAQALIGGLAGRLTAASNIHIVDVMPTTLTLLSERFGVTTAQAPTDVLAACDVIVLAVKPQQLREVVATIKPFLKLQLVLSIAAGIRAADISRWLGGHQAIVRTMPNTPALIGQGITGAYAMSGVTELQKRSADALLRAVGETVWVTDEAQIDAVTAISGSGPHTCSISSRRCSKPQPNWDSALSKVGSWHRLLSLVLPRWPVSQMSRYPCCVSA
jgi:pyrroline-5-carboxylate reductase